MNPNPHFDAPWHRMSFDTFTEQTLPALLSRELILSGYNATRSPDGHLCVRFRVETPRGQADVEFADLPAPNEEGVFVLDSQQVVVEPRAETEDLSSAAVLCVGELLENHVAHRMGCPPSGIVWDESALRSWFPLDRWFRELLTDMAHALDDLNWLARTTHLRRVRVEEPSQAVHPGQRGRACPYETPEGPNNGRVFTIARGATIRDRRIQVTDTSPGMALGLSAACIPFLEHNDGARNLMGANMRRQWCPPLEPEPALVCTAQEPEVPGFWCGRNLLTAFACAGADTYKDAVLLSSSAAEKLGDHRPVEVGDKLSNRHGTKGVVSRIVPDDRMPALPDGTPADIITSAIGVHVRMNVGQLLEAVAGRIAHATGAPFVAPPFAAPSPSQLREALAEAGLDPGGMEPLILPDGTQTQAPVTVGWVYWGRTNHLACNKLHAWSTHGSYQRQGEMEQYALRETGAYELALENLNTRSAARLDAQTLSARVAQGPIEQAQPPTPLFLELRKRLRIAGIGVDFEESRLRFSLGQPSTDDLELALPVRHPWLDSVKLGHVGQWPESATYAGLCEANERLAGLLTSGAPQVLIDGAHDRVRELLTRLLGELDLRWHLTLGSRVLFSARSVVVPHSELSIDQIGLPEDMARSLFEPLARRGSNGPVTAADLDSVITENMVTVNRAPTFSATALMAFRPVRSPGRAIRLHPLVCRWMNADFDGDQMAVMLPLTAEGQREARECLSVRGHLSKDPGLLESLLPDEEMLWGLAWLGLEDDGRRKIVGVLGHDVAPGELVGSEWLWRRIAAMRAESNTDRVLEILEELGELGRDAATRAGYSMGPFWGSDLALPERPGEGANPDYRAVLTEALSSFTDYATTPSGMQVLAVKSGARGSMEQLVRLESLGFPEGLTPEQSTSGAEDVRRRFADIVAEQGAAGYLRRSEWFSAGYGVLARARRAAAGSPGNPGKSGIVFARAAAAGEIDPLSDEESRLFAGLRPLEI